MGKWSSDLTTVGVSFAQGTCDITQVLLVGREAPLTQLVVCQTLDRKVRGSNLGRGLVLFLEQDISSSLLSTGWFNPRKRPDMTEKLMTGT